MSLPGNCNGNQTTLLIIGACVELKFVLGRLELDHKDTIKAENATYHDMIDLEIHENNDGGKIGSWMNYAVKNIHHANFVGKGDMDTFIFLTDLAKDVANMPIRSLYYGKFCTYECCGGYVYCPTNYIYMAGQLYFLSLDLIHFASDLANSMQTHTLDEWVHPGM
jgi:hypothetical protein